MACAIGHEHETCAKTYATATQEASAKDDCVLTIDDEEAEAAERDAASEVPPPDVVKEFNVSAPEKGHPPREALRNRHTAVAKLLLSFWFRLGGNGACQGH